ncbi:hypothetical protein ABTK28_21245, partial [Acinetobacter baumannii]
MAVRTSSSPRPVERDTMNLPDAATLDVAGLERDVEQRTDVYFKRTRAVVRSHGDKQVTYAVFMRRPVIFAARLMI